MVVGERVGCNDVRVWCLCVFVGQRFVWLLRRIARRWVVINVKAIGQDMRARIVLTFPRCMWRWCDGQTTGHGHQGWHHVRHDNVGCHRIARRQHVQRCLQHGQHMGPLLCGHGHGLVMGPGCCGSRRSHAVQPLHAQWLGCHTACCQYITEVAHRIKGCDCGVTVGVTRSG